MASDIFSSILKYPKIPQMKRNLTLVGAPTFNENGVTVTTNTGIYIPSTWNVINKTQGTIRFDVNIASLPGSIVTLMSTDTGGSTNRIAVMLNGSTLYLYFGSLSATYVSMTSGKHTIAVTYNSTSAKLYVDTFTTPVATINNPTLPTTPGNVSIGSGTGLNPGTTYWCSIPISNMVISNVVRTSSNMNSFVIDNNTRFASDLKDVISYTNPIIMSNQVTEDTITVSQAPNTYKAWPEMCKLNDGTLIMCYRSSNTLSHGYDATGKKVIRKSVDNGKTWSDEEIIADYAYDLDPAHENISENIGGGLLVTTINDVETIFHVFNARTSTEYKLYIHKSRDGCKTWSTPVLISNKKSCETNPILLSNGNLLISAFGLNASNALDGKFYMCISEDNADTWTCNLINTDTTNQWSETAVIETKTNGSYSGEVIAIARSAQFAPNGHFGLFKSTDYGATWADPVNITAITTYLPTRCRLLRSGNKLLLVTSDSSKNQCIWISVDEGTNWTKLYTFHTGTTTRGYADMAMMLKHLGIVWCTNLTSPEYSDIYFTKIPRIVLGL